MYTLLVVERHSGLRQALTDVLELDGYCVIQARNGLEAMSLMRQQVPHLILSAARTPPLTGVELLNLVKSNNYLHHIPFIFVTGSEYLEKMLIDKHMQHKVTDIIKKPFSAADLLSVIKTSLSLYHPVHTIPDYDLVLRTYAR